SYTDDFMYSRTDNPNRRTLEQALATLEGGSAAYAFSSGMAAVAAVFQSLSPGDHVILPDDIYFNIYLLADRIYKRWGLEFTSVDMRNPEAIQQACRKNTRLIWTESPSNPQLKITDIAAVVDIARPQNILVAVDNTWPTPVWQRPLALGADLVIHSTTKYFGGHSDVIGGCVITRDSTGLSERFRDIQNLSGAVPAPFDCWLISRGIQTLHVRVRAQTKTAGRLATFLDQHPKIEQVNYPGLESHAGHDIAKKQMSGYGAMLSALVKGSGKQAIETSNRLRLFTTATSLGGVESLVEHRKSIEGPHSLTPDNLLRISVGLENEEDLIRDWEQALR
ncbi:MAG: aminotransferase class I/II-fold pyridoxal phosphate-dependent enzyme, partial [Saprospiraceae bacterium]|nr:aminotransferase class I/II-fold pyridoxal phosphate-dependent enzyme [Saprospiraceae bacterium]